MARAELEIVARLRDEASEQARGLSDSLGNIGKVAAVGVAAAAAAVGGLAFAFRDSIDLAREDARAVAQLNQVIESTGGAAGLTAQQVQDMAVSLQAVTNFGDDTIITGQNLLLTFKNIGGDIFPRVTEAMLDMSQAFGQDVTSSAIQLGKALEDPVNGLTALRRVGVSFTEEQKAMVEAMVEAGDTMGAQTLILAELESQFGGSARALAEPAIQAQNAWGDFKELVGAIGLAFQNELGAIALPYIQEASAWLAERLPAAMEQARAAAQSAFAGISEAVQWAIANFETIRTVALTVGAAFGTFVILTSVVTWVTAVGAAFATASTVIAAAGGVIGAVVAILGGPLTIAIAAVALAVGALALAWQTNFMDIQRHTQTAMDAINRIMNMALDGIRVLWNAWNLARQGEWRAFGEELRRIWDNTWEAIAGFLHRTWGAIRTALATLVSNIKGFFSSIDWGEVGSAIVSGIARGITGALPALRDAARNAANAALEAAKGFLGIQSPSKVMAEEVGKPMAQGVIEGYARALAGGSFGAPAFDAATTGGHSGIGGALLAGATINIYANDYAGGRAAGAGFHDELRSRGLA